ncbi:MAG: hydroxymethylglutaryl-CoA lyase [Gammaproteobacteria bacterium RIFCSPHIGHO2_12_FULL_40_19]|nr:MAG: hydroxymethylglutaryl-CoA lyase [Gammaproteobacteria bacterium RIFCSPHIGHO2_12_FULL_40_19]
MNQHKSSFPTHVTLTEVSPRDGLQNETAFVPTDIKIQFIRLLADAGFAIIEATSFVNPKKIPALADHTFVMKTFSSNAKTKYAALIPNVQGLQNAIDAGCNHIAVITAASETFAQKNMNCSIDASLARIQAILAIAKPKNIFVRAYISCTLGCPYEGFIQPEITAKIAQKLLLMGCDEIAVADTIGTGTPLKTHALILAVNQYVPIEKIAIHFHDTYGQAIANIFTCLQLGVAKIDASVGSLGGCPYAKGATGNVATESVLYLLNDLHIETGVDLNKVIKAREFIRTHLK